MLINHEYMDCLPFVSHQDIVSYRMMKKDLKDSFFFFFFWIHSVLVMEKGKKKKLKKRKKKNFLQ